VKTYNPFIPTVPLMTVQPRPQRERFKRVVFGVLAAQLGLLLLLLAKDYMKRYSTALDITNVSATTMPEEKPILEQNMAANGSRAAMDLPQSALQAQHLGQVQALSQTHPTQKEDNTSTAAQSATIYVVKSGDTLTGIARRFSTTIRAVKAVNGLATERLTVGTQLKIPNSKALVAFNGQPEAN
jgi:LysM repeat protein